MDAIGTDQLGVALLRDLNAKIAAHMACDCMFVKSAIVPPLDGNFRVVVESIKQSQKKRPRLLLVLETTGGYMETVERLVAVMRKHYQEVFFVVPDHAFSAGTVLALSGDKIFMDYYSVLGPIDPQYRGPNGELLPGYGYLDKFRQFMEMLNQGAIPKPAERTFLLGKFDPAILFQIEQSFEHAISLITRWLPKYKFKNWHRTQTKKIKVTPNMKHARAKEIAETLGNAEKWHSHGRGISMQELSGPSIKLHIDDLGADPVLSDDIKHYHGLANEFFRKSQAPGRIGYIHSALGGRRIA